MSKLAALFLFLALLVPSYSYGQLSEWELNNIGVYKKAGPGVVYISSVALKWDHFLNVVPTSGSGSGVIIDKKGHILTNYHVVQKAHRLEVTLADGSKFAAKIVGADPSNDTAVIKIKAPKGKLTAVPLGKSSSLLVGQKVLAIGNPFGLERTLTVGCVSSIGRDLRAPDGVVIKGVIQTDAAINPGNSGGPLLDSQGKIIGINTAIFSPSGGSVGIGFAVPIDTIKRIIPDLIAYGAPRHPWLGVEFMHLTAHLAKQLGLRSSSGALVQNVYSRGPAHKAGIRGGFRRYYYGNTIIALGGDLIVGFDGEKVEDAEQLGTLIAKHKPGDTIIVDVIRFDGKEKSLRVKLGQRPKDY